MRQIALTAVPNQSFTARLDDTRFVLRIKEARGVMVADLERAGVTVLSGTRILAGEPIIPYHYLEGGNFIMLTLDDELPDWNLFGVSQSLFYITEVEVSQLNAVTTEAGALFDRAGYVLQYLTDDAGFYLTEDNGELLIEA